MNLIETIIANAKAAGAFKAALIPMELVPFDAELRKACEANMCGGFGKNWMCPPYVGEIDELIIRAKAFQQAFVYQTVGNLEDSFDIEGMEAAAKTHHEVTSRIADMLVPHISGNFLQLSVGGCPICETCAKVKDEPCRYPEKALASLESYGISVATMAARCEMKYINGVNTVTYFGAIFFNDLAD